MWYDGTEQNFPELAAAARTARLSGRLGHSYLIYGDNGKVCRDFALYLAMTVACPSPAPDGRACGVCHTCRHLLNGTYAEWFELSPTSKSRRIQIGASVDDPDTVRWFDERFYYRSLTEAGYKIGVIVDADRMMPEAQNAFLKTLEEPPPDTLLILITANPAGLLATIRSRCQVIPLLTNRVSYEFNGIDELRGALSDLQFNAGGNLVLAERCAEKIIDLAGKLKKAAGDEVEAEWAEKLRAFERMDNPAAKKREQGKMEAAAAARYLKLRQEFLSAIHAWFAQNYLLGNGVAADLLPNPEMAPPECVTCEADEACRQLDLADNLLRDLRWSVSEELALRGFCLSVAMG